MTTADKIRELIEEKGLSQKNKCACEYTLPQKAFQLC